MSENPPCVANSPRFSALRRGTAFWLKFLGGLQQQAGVRFGKYRFKLAPGQPHPDELKIVLTGRHIPATFQRAALWSAKRHGIPTA